MLCSEVNTRAEFPPWTAKMKGQCPWHRWQLLRWPWLCFQERKRMHVCVCVCGSTSTVWKWSIRVKREVGGKLLTLFHRFPQAFCPLSPFHHVFYCASLISFALISVANHPAHVPAGRHGVTLHIFPTQREMCLSPGLWWTEFQIITNPLMLFNWGRAWLFFLGIIVPSFSTV